ncbi:MAG TPA: hypothetical protein VGG61_15460, partial [Gemmataceae bacterium]
VLDLPLLAQGPCWLISHPARSPTDISIGRGFSPSVKQLCLDCPILLFAPRDDPQHPIGQGPLQLQRLDGFALEPEIELLASVVKKLKSSY